MYQRCRSSAGSIEGATSTNAPTRSGRSTARRAAIGPPRLCPTTTAGWTWLRVEHCRGGGGLQRERRLGPSPPAAAEAGAIKGDETRRGAQHGVLEEGLVGLPGSGRAVDEQDPRRVRSRPSRSAPRSGAPPSGCQAIRWLSIPPRRIDSVAIAGEKSGPSRLQAMPPAIRKRAPARRPTRIQRNSRTAPFYRNGRRNGAARAARRHASASIAWRAAAIPSWSSSGATAKESRR